jgi:hypothetical protein
MFLNHILFRLAVQGRASKFRVSPDMGAADFGCFRNSESVLKGKRFSDVRDIKSSAKKNRQTFLYRILETVSNYYIALGAL